MSLAVLAVVTWIIIIVFAYFPKRFTLTEMIFLYFVSSIMTVTAFTLFDVNFQWVTATRIVEKSLALDICRFVEIDNYIGINI